MLSPKKVIASPALAPTNVLLLAVELTPALKPTAVFPVPFVLVNNAVAPTAVFWFALLFLNALSPIATFSLPDVPLTKASSPTAVFLFPDVLERYGYFWNKN